jgi:hypothetical protein
VADPVEERLQIDIDHPPVAVADIAPGGLDRLMGATPRTEPEARRREPNVEDG